MNMHVKQICDSSNVFVCAIDASRLSSRRKFTTTLEADRNDGNAFNDAIPLERKFCVTSTLSLLSTSFPPPKAVLYLSSGAGSERSERDSWDPNLKKGDGKWHLNVHFSVFL